MKVKVIKDLSVLVQVKELNEPFNPTKWFEENAEINYLIGPMFSKNVLDGISLIDHVDSMTFFAHTCKFMSTREICVNLQSEKGLMSKEAVIWAIADLTSRQPKGEEGCLANDGTATVIGSIFCDNMISEVSLYWYKHEQDTGCWVLNCNDLHLFLPVTKVLNQYS